MMQQGMLMSGVVDYQVCGKPLWVMAVSHVIAQDVVLMWSVQTRRMRRVELLLVT
jgi:hypothetical protein